LNTDLLLAAKKVVRRFEQEWLGVGGGTMLAEEVMLLKQLVLLAEDELDQEAVYYNRKRASANREYNEMMLRGGE
tara:strand:+ start:6340 stop:6564 length:225 start_codon:yes stop_codon:yes gene_type:complete